MSNYFDHLLAVGLVAVAVLSSTVPQDKGPEIRSLVVGLSCILIQFNIQQLSDRDWQKVE